MKRLKKFFSKLEACIDFLFNSKDDLWTIIYNIPDEEYMYITDDDVNEQNEDFKTMIKRLYMDVVLSENSTDNESNIED